MNILAESIPELLGALGSAGVVGAVVWCIGRWRSSRCQDAANLRQGTTSETGAPYQAIRRYTLLGTVGGDGGPIQVLSTQPAGVILVWSIGGRQERFALTDVRLFDGTFAAEAVDRYERIR